MVLPTWHARAHARGVGHPVVAGLVADALTDRLHVDVQDPLHDLVRQGRLRRVESGGRFLYTAADSRRAKDQVRARRAAHKVPLVADATALAVSPVELKAAILASSAESVGQ